MKFESGDLAICDTCGTQYDVPLSSAPTDCRICEDPRQYVPLSGPRWTSLNIAAHTQKNTIGTDPHDPRIYYITTHPLSSAELPKDQDRPATKQIGIGERAILLETPAGNVLWDLIAFLDDATVEFIKEKGGLKAMVISHPHFYTTHLEWAHVFKCPVYMSRADEMWLNREDRNGQRRLINGVTEVIPGVTAIQAGGHFDGSLVLHWEEMLFVADTMMVVPSAHAPRPNTTSFSFMWSYPNMIPLPPAKIHGIWAALKPFTFDAVYGGFPGQNVRRKGLKGEVLDSMKMFLRTGGHERVALFEETFDE